MGENNGCHRCGAQIMWVEAPDGTRPAVNWPGQRRLVLDGKTLVARMRNTFVNHQATCSQVERRRRTGGG